MIHSFLPEYGPERKKRVLKDALKLHEGDSGEILVCRVMCDGNTLTSASLVKKECKLTSDSGFYDYTKAKADEDAWFVNFADPVLFVAYDSDMFAQDEIQTLEMPLLASCCRYLDEKRPGGFVTKTNVDGNPTPYLFRNVPYWISVNTRPVLNDGTTGNIYGNAFASASDEEIRAGIRTFEGNVRCNVLAIAAPREGVGRYSEDEIAELMKTLLCSFSAVREQSRGKTVIHSGNWGCGAFGGNKELMYLAQMYAAGVCGINELVLHAVDEKALERAKRSLGYMGGEMKLKDVIAYLLSKGFEWGVGDGN